MKAGCASKSFSANPSTANACESPPFTLHLPNRPALRKRLLVVDDERIVAEDISECLEAMGCEVLGIAITGEQAITLAGAHRPDLVLMDICLQGHVDGVEAALAIRDRWQIPVVFLTAYSDPGVLQRAKQAGPARVHRQAVR